MEYVEPIRDPEKVRQIGLYLYSISPKLHVLYYTGIFAGLRISEILRLKVRDVSGEEIEVIDPETGDVRHVAINPALRKIYDVYTAEMSDWDYLIPSARRINKPITREYAYRKIREAGQLFGVSNLGTHSLRKTFGYHFYKQTHNIGLLMTILNYNTEEKALRYIGAEQDAAARAIRDLRVGPEGA